MLLAVVSVADFATGPNLELTVFYLIPVSFFGWFAGRRSGLFSAVISAVLAFAAHRAHLDPSRSVYAYWNGLAWLAVYVFFVFIISELRSLYTREQISSHTDALTGIANRRAFFEELETEKERARRYTHALTLAYVDLDRFKQVNDTLGHAAGDKLLVTVARTMKQEVRRTDVIARLGGDEFAVILPETDILAAKAALMKLRTSLDAAMRKRNWPVTFSIGVVIFRPPPESAHAMVTAADSAMYRAKENGRGELVIQIFEHR